MKLLLKWLFPPFKGAKHIVRPHYEIVPGTWGDWKGREEFVHSSLRDTPVWRIRDDLGKWLQTHAFSLGLPVCMLWQSHKYRAHFTSLARAEYAMEALQKHRRKEINDAECVSAIFWGPRD